MSDELHTEILRQRMKRLESELSELKGQKEKSLASGSKSMTRQQILQQQQNLENSEQKKLRSTYKNNKVSSLLSQLNESAKRSDLITHPNPKSSSKPSQTVHELKSTLQLNSQSDKKNPRKNKQTRTVLNLTELKQQNNQVHSNIFNVAVAEIMTDEHEKFEMISEIKELKGRVQEYEKRKKEQRFRSSGGSQLFFDEMAESFKMGSRPDTGRIYRRSRLSENEQSGVGGYDLGMESQPNSIQLRRSSNPLTWNPEMTLTQQQIGVGSGCRGSRPKELVNRAERLADLPKEFEGRELINSLNNTKPNFRKRSTSKNATKGKTSGRKTDFVTAHKHIPSKIKHMLNTENQKPPSDLIDNFREHISSITLSTKLPSNPTPYDSQSDLQALGKIVFLVFEVDIDQQLQKNPKAQYKVTKYQNCILFRLDQERNIVWYFSGKFYFGGWQISITGQGRKQGFGYEYIPGSYSYQGFFKLNKRSGYGVMVMEFNKNANKNLIYEGQWLQGVKNGVGYQIEYQSGVSDQLEIEYLGEFKDGLKIGRAKVRTDWTFYEGEIKDGIKEGRGYEILKNEDEYYGWYRNNEFNGKGQYKWKNGAYFYGDFVDGKRKGHGMWISDLNSTEYDTYNGAYEDNKKHGFGVYKWANGTIYEGYFKKDLKHDQGLMKQADGKAAKFIWIDGNVGHKIYSVQEEEYRKRRGSVSMEKINQDQNYEDGTPRIGKIDLKPISIDSFRELEKKDLQMFYGMTQRDTYRKKRKSVDGVGKNMSV